MEASIWNLHGRQIKNGGLATEPNDFVILKQLGASATTQTQNVQTNVEGFGEFSFQADFVAPNPGFRVAINNFSVDLPKVQTQRVNFCYTPSPVVGSDLVVKVVISKDGGANWQTLDTLTIPTGLSYSWPAGNPPKQRSNPYSSPPYLTLDPGDFLNFTVESGASPGLTVKVNTHA